MKKIRINEFDRKKVTYNNLEHAKEYFRNFIRDYATENNMLFKEEQLIESEINGATAIEELYLVTTKNGCIFGILGIMLVTTKEKLL